MPSKRTGFVFILFVVVATAVVVVAMQNNQVDTVNVQVNNQSNNQTNTANTDSKTADDNKVAVDPVVSADGSYTILQKMTTTTVGEIVSYTFTDGNALSVMPEAMQSAVLNETPVIASTEITIAEQTATQYTLSSAKDGSHFSVVQVIRNGQLFDFRGNADYLNNLSTYIQFN